MLFQSPEGSATKPQYRIDSISTGPGVERHARQGHKTERELHGLDGDCDGDRDTHTKPGGLFHDVYVDLIPKEEAETVCAFVSPTHSLDLDLDPLHLATHSNRGRHSNKDGNSNKDDTGTASILHPSTFLSPVRTSSAGDIDFELRARLQVRLSFFSLFSSLHCNLLIITLLFSRQLIVVCFAESLLS